MQNQQFKAIFFIEYDNSITATLDDFDLVVNAEDVETAKSGLASELVEYAEEYFDNFQLYYNSTNRKQHFPYLLRVMLSHDLAEVKELISL